MAERTELILASASEGRAAILRQAGIAFTQQPAAIDERSLEREAVTPRDGLAGARLAGLLAAAKAEHVSALNPNALVIGADQVMVCDGKILHKPATVEEAKQQLRRLRGKSHRLSTALCVACGGKAVWSHLDEAELTMRDFSDEFLDEYCRAEGKAILQSVGAYRIEGLGIQLFSDIQGDHFTIIGLPLLPLLGYLRHRGCIAR
jgi:septum formation protein